MPLFEKLWCGYRWELWNVIHPQAMVEGFNEAIFAMLSSLSCDNDYLELELEKEWSLKKIQL